MLSIVERLLDKLEGVTAEYQLARDLKPGEIVFLRVKGDYTGRVKRCTEILVEAGGEAGVMALKKAAADKFENNEAAEIEILDGRHRPIAAKTNRVVGKNWQGAIEIR